MNSENYQIPKLTADNYFDWIVKMKSVLKSKELYQLVLGKELTKVRGEDRKIIEINQSLCLNKAHALIITRVHSSIYGRVSGCISKFWDGVAVLQSLDSTVDKTILGHIILMKLPLDLSHVRNAIIASGTTSSVKVTYETFLKMLDSQTKADTSMLASGPHKPADIPNDTAKALLTCPQGVHLPNNKSHTSDQCFSLHPELLTEFRKQKKERKNAKAHLAMLESPSLFNVEANPTQYDTVNKLVAFFNNLLANLDSHSDAHESEASLF
ncbi:hypothetical protein PCANC_11586 [Puccinia coronata f. sp. avenae]|uniref:DUF4219 domain-containing protein n=1 Tax=Puccinia coronata f. sp. avenae TaxID=200324 RepID=A0A2N5V862_9BASI|nr:hypothetical protein PCANC_11586 [Puccinia coronata f. sp. avenae]